MNNSKTLKKAIEEKLPCPFCGNTDYRKCEIKIVRIDGEEFGMRIICKNIIPKKGHCGTDLSFETDKNIKEPLYGRIIPIPSPSEHKLGIVFIKIE